MHSADVQSPVSAPVPSVFATRTYGFAVFLAALAAFLATCITDDKLEGLILAARPWLPSALSTLAVNKMYVLINYGLTPTKNLVFTLGFAVLAAPVVASLRTHWREILDRHRVLLAMIAFVVFFAFMATVVPVALGFDYEKASSSPFTQPANWLYRRILLPYLANLFRADGIYYAVFFWIVAFAAFLVLLVWLKRKGFQPTWLEMISFLSVGVFFACYVSPGYPEVLCVLLATIAFIRFEEAGRFTLEQVAYFVLALLTHEAAALIIFGPIALCIFGWRSYAPFAAIFTLYICAWLLNYGFDVTSAIKAQTIVGEKTAWQYFLDQAALLPVVMVSVFKLYFLALPLGIWAYVKAGRLNLACYILVAFVLSVAVCTIATDTSRMISLSMFAVLIGALPWLSRMSVRLRQGLALANLLIPTLYFTSNGPMYVGRGLYGLVLRHLP